MKSLFRFSMICLLVVGLNAHATEPVVTQRREPVILDLYRAIGKALNIGLAPIEAAGARIGDAFHNGPAVIAATGTAMVVALFFANRQARAVDDLWGPAILPMIGTFFGTLLVVNNGVPVRKPCS